MGMFDELKCKYLLPDPIHNTLDYQTKDTPAQFLDEYEIREDGTLWHEEYDLEDRSDPNAKGVMKLAGFMTKVNRQWHFLSDFTDCIRFYTHDENKRWIQYAALFDHGKLIKIEFEDIQW